MDKCMNSLSVCMLLICVKGKVGRIKASKKDVDEKALLRYFKADKKPTSNHSLTKT